MTEKQYKKLVLSLGCIITGEDAVPHHPKCFNSGWGQVSDYFIIPLAPRLHTMQDDSVHQNKSLFEDRYGREQDLLAQTWQRVLEHLHNDSSKNKERG